MIRYREIEYKNDKIKRIFVAGSSSSGKTTLCRKMIIDGFFGPITKIYYFHPDFHSDNPIQEWEASINKPILVRGGLPNFDDLVNLSSNSLIILDDLIQEILDNKDIDYLFRVLSSKKKLHVVVMSQRYFIGGKYGLSIRNSSNYHILLRNADERTNTKVGALFNLKNEIILAQKFNSKKLYPYILIDRTPQARVSNCQVFINILGKYKQIIIESMIYYLISDQDFNSIFDRIDQTHASLKHGADKTSTSTGRDSEDCRISEKRRVGGQTETRRRSTGQTSLARKRHLERSIRQTLARYKLQGKL